MFANILVPVDLTPKNRRAVTTAVELARQSGGAVTLFHVIETIDLPEEELEDFYRRLEKKAAAGMNELAVLAASTDPAPDTDGVTIHQLTAYGDRAREVVRQAEEGSSDLIILSSHRFNPDDPGHNWATISHKVAILSQCPVLLVK